jgi:hypothetical protein
MAGGITQTGIFDKTKANKSKIQAELRSALEILVKNDIELIICEVCKTYMNLRIFRSLTFFLVF